MTRRLSCTDTEIRGFKDFGVTSLTFWGQVTSSVTWSLDSAYVVSYWWSTVTILHCYRNRKPQSCICVFKAKKFTAHAPCHVTCRQVVQNDHIFGIPEAILPIYYTTFMGLRWRLGAVYRWNFYTGAFLGPVFDFGGIFQGLYNNFEFRFPKSFDPCMREAALSDPSRVKICRAVWPVGRSTKKVYISEKNFRYISPICRKAPNGRICTKFCTGSRLADVITCFKFCVDRLRGFVSARGRILPFSIVFRSPLTQSCATARLWPTISWCADIYGTPSKLLTWYASHCTIFSFVDIILIVLYDSLL